MIFKKLPRLLDVALVALFLLLALCLLGHQQDLPVLVYKLAMIYVAGFCGYLFDLSAFPYARPHGYLQMNWRASAGFVNSQADHSIAEGYHLVFACAMLRRAVIVFAFVEGMTRGM